MGNFILIWYHRGGWEVREWSDSYPHFPIVWSAVSDSRCSRATLLAPGFLAVQSETLSDQEDGVISADLEIFDLDGFAGGARRIAKFSFPVRSNARQPLFLASGAKLAPGEDGLFVVSFFGCLVSLSSSRRMLSAQNLMHSLSLQFLLEISVLVSILFLPLHSSVV